MDSRFSRGACIAFCAAIVSIGAFAQDSGLSASNTGPYCAGSTISLYASSSDPAASFSWSGPNNYASTDQNPIIAAADVSNAGTYSVTSNGTTTTTAVAVNPTASITAPAHITTGDTAKANGPDGAPSYAWTASGNGALASGQNAKAAIFTAGAPGVMTLALNTGCSVATQSVVVDPQPTISVTNVSSQTGPKGTTTPFTFRISLSTPSSETVTVQYWTSDGTAHVGRDYQYTFGTATFQPGQTYKDVSVPVYGTNSNPFQTFAFNLMNAQNASVQKIPGTTISMKGKGSILAK